MLVCQLWGLLPQMTIEPVRLEQHEMNHQYEHACNERPRSKEQHHRQQSLFLEYVGSGRMPHLDWHVQHEAVCSMVAAALINGCEESKCAVTNAIDSSPNSPSSRLSDHASA